MREAQASRLFRQSDFDGPVHEQFVRFPEGGFGRRHRAIVIGRAASFGCVSIKWASGQDGQVVREKGVYIIFILYLLSTTTYYYYSLIYLTHLTQKRKTPVN